MLLAIKFDILLKFCLLKFQANYNIMEFNNHIISHMTSHMINLTQSGRFSIIIYSKIDFSLIIHYLTYLIFLINLYSIDSVTSL